MKRDDQSFAALVPTGLCLGVVVGAVLGFFMDDPTAALWAGAAFGLSFGAALFGLAAAGSRRDAANDD